MAVYVPKTSITAPTDLTYTPIVAVEGAVAPGDPSAGEGGTLVMGNVTTANPAYTNATANALSLTTTGQLRTALYSSTGTAAVLDATGALVVRLTSSSATGLLMGRVMSAATTNATSLKASVGAVYAVSLNNVGAAAVFFKFYNKASAPTVGTDVPVWTIAIGANQMINFNVAQGLAFGTGIAYAITNLVADTDTTAVVLNQVTGMISYV